MSMGSSDSAIVIVKSVANEGVVTYLRIKLPASAKDGGDDGQNM
jgi:hypothetical protein